MAWHKRLPMGTMALLLMTVCCLRVVGEQTVILLDASTRYQTITGWEATAQAGQLACDPSDFGGDPIVCPAFRNYQDALLDAAANDLGINRLRVEVFPGIENRVDYYAQFLAGEITERDWAHVHAHEIVNDNADPNVIHAGGFHFTALDHQMNTVVLPMKARLEARGEKLFINICYVDFRSDPAQFQHYNHPEEYAEFVLATYQHLQSRYGLIPDAWEIVLEPDNTPFTGSRIGQVMQVTAERLQANGLTPRFIAPSTTNMTNAQSYLDAIQAIIGDSGVREYLAELSYHRYAGVSDGSLRWIGDTARAAGIGAAMLEHIGSGYADLHQDLTLGQNTAWSQYVLAAPSFWGTSDDGDAYYRVDDRVVSAPKVLMASRTRFLRQYFRFVRSGAQRIGAAGDSTFNPVAFVHPDGRTVVVIKAAAGGAFAIEGLPAGTYGATYTTDSAYDIALPDIALSAGERLSASIPSQGVITVYAKAELPWTATASPYPITATSTGTPSPRATIPSSTVEATGTATRSASATMTAERWRILLPLISKQRGEPPAAAPRNAGWRPTSLPQVGRTIWPNIWAGFRRSWAKGDSR